MLDYKQHIHYNTESLSLQEKADLLIAAHAVCSYWWVDKLDCTVSYCRQKIEMPFDEIRGHLTERCHFVVIHRRGFVKPHLEVGFCTMGLISYFLWMQVPIKLKKQFVKNLSVL